MRRLGVRSQGVLSVFDPPRHDTKETIEKAVENGVEVKMITGDQTAIAVETCRMLGMGTKVRSVRRRLRVGLLPASVVVSSDLVRAPAAARAQILNTEALNGNLGTHGTTLGEVILGANGFAEVYPEHKFQSALPRQRSAGAAVMSVLLTSLLSVLCSCSSPAVHSCRGVASDGLRHGHDW